VGRCNFTFNLLHGFVDRLSPKRFDQYKEDIHIRNYEGILTFSLIGMMFGLADLLISLLIGSSARIIIEFLCFFFYFLILHLLVIFFVSSPRHSTLLFYLIEIPLMIAGILIGTVLDPANPAILFLIFLCVAPLFIMDKPWRIVLFILVSAGVFIAVAALSKPADVFRRDLINVFSYGTISLGINLYTLADKIDSTEAKFRFKNMAEHDLLTNVYNRGTGDARISTLLNARIPGSFIIMDIDNFKTINDTYGHTAGDQVLQALSDTLNRVFRSSDVIMRLGGDEFVVYALGLTEPANVTHKLEELIQTAEQIHIAAMPDRAVRISAGCVINHGDILIYERMYRMADRCLYEAKRSSKGKFVIQQNSSQ
jgi:diguanylate cyclase (GGDEF)-like protein